MGRDRKSNKNIDKNLPIPDVVVNDPTLVARDTAMFQKWMAGTSLTDIAKEYGLTQGNVSSIKKKYNWHGLMNEVKRRAFKASFTQLKEVHTELVKVIKHDIKLLTEEAIRENRQLTEKERVAVAALLDRTDRISRLEDGKPTENTGVLSVQIKMPPGVKHYGIIPPDPRVKYVTMETEEEKPVIDLDALEEDEREESDE